MTLLLAVSAVLASSVLAQSPEQGPLVTVNVDVTDARGQAIAGLTAADFRVYEDERIRRSPQSSEKAIFH